MPEDRRSVDETCTAIIAAIRESGVPEVTMRQPPEGIAAAPTSRVVQAIGRRVIGWAGS